MSDAVSPEMNTGGKLFNQIKSKLTAALRPSVLEIRDDSALHRHHAAMKGVTAPETHFAVTVVSPQFQGKSLVQRHQMVYKLLDTELKEQGLHALQITAKTEAEFNAQ
ncbi:hypothetical protein HK101_003302 [Irineochytrium annulatum]|nr:hypothetical protein HK101_003302 [Irineochytrium annulatum]